MRPDAQLESWSRLELQEGESGYNYLKAETIKSLHWRDKDKGSGFYGTHLSRPERNDSGQLRARAGTLEHEAVQGYSQLNKEPLLLAVCQALAIDPHEHHEAVGIDKAKIKADIRKLKVDRRAALEAKDHQELKKIRREIRGLKREIRKSLV